MTEKSSMFLMTVAATALWLSNLWTLRIKIRKYPDAKFPRVMLIIAYIALAWNGYMLLKYRPW